MYGEGGGTGWKPVSPSTNRHERAKLARYFPESPLFKRQAVSPLSFTSALFLGASFAWLLASPLPALAESQRPSLDPSSEFAELSDQIDAAKNWDRARLAREVLRPEALILASDRTPVEIVWRRTTALLADLKRMTPPPDLAAESAALEALRPEIAAFQQPQLVAEGRQRDIFARLTVLRRQIAFKNPLLDFEGILFLKHNPQCRGDRHMVDQYLGFNQEKAGGVYLLEKPFGGKASVKNLLAGSAVQSGRLRGRNLVDNGSFLALDLDYDARTILFAFSEAEFAIPPGASFADQTISAGELAHLRGRNHYFFRPESAFHIFKARVDGSNVEQLTDGKWNDYDPCFLPNGRIVFISERDGGNERCGVRPLPSAILHAMMPDGSDIIPLSWHDTNEWQPSVDNHGMLAYTRWDYVDRDSDVAHHLWLCYPDGRDPRSLHGNYPDRRELRPWMEMSIRAIPNSNKYIATAAPHHGDAYGSLVLIDLREKDDRAMSQLRRITPEGLFPESEIRPGVPREKKAVMTGGKSTPATRAGSIQVADADASPRPVSPKPVHPEAFGTPWPLSEDYYLCVYDSKARHHGIYLVDSFGNRELLYRDPAIGCVDPIPFRPRPRPPVIPTATTQARADRSGGSAPGVGTVSVMNVYEGEQPLPREVKIKELRVISLFPKNNTPADVPPIGAAAQSLARGVLGTVPVEEDGSVCFEMPVGVAVYFQLLDAQGVAVQSMRSDTYLHPGERLTCVGCHEDKRKTFNVAAGRALQAFRRPPSALKPEAEGSYPLTFPRLVQPVVDAKCVACHDRNPKAPDLHGDRFVKNGWSQAFSSLRKYAWGMSGGNGTARRQIQISIPGSIGARASLLYPMLARGHHEVKLSPQELRRVTLWLDCNSNFYGAYERTEEQAKGRIVRPVWGVPAWTDFEKLAR